MVKMLSKSLLVISLFSACSAQKKTSQGPTFQLPEDPPPPLKEEVVGLIRLDAQEDAMIIATNGELDNDRLQTRFINCTNRFNAEGADAVKPCKDAVNKTLNSISLDTELKKAKWIGPAGTIAQINLLDYGLSPAKWKLIEDADPFKFTSETVRGRTLQFLTGTARPWIDGDNFAETSLVKAYYGIIDVPGNFRDFQKSIGVNLQQDFDKRDRDLIIMGMNKSLITSNRQYRLIIRAQGTFGPLWCTEDTDDQVIAPIIVDGEKVNQKNLLEAPFPIFARSQKTFVSNAGECLFIGPNGTMRSALFDAAGVRQDFAPTNIVQDPTSAALGLSSTITNARSCFRCHATGFIPIRDTIGAHIQSNTSFNAADKEKGRLFYKTNAAGDAFFARDNSKYSGVLDDLDIDNPTEDSINALTDTLRGEQTITQVAGRLYITEDELRVGLNSSTAASAVLGALLQDNGRVNLQQLIDGLPILIEEMNLFQDDI